MILSLAFLLANPWPEHCIGYENGWCLRWAPSALAPIDARSGETGTGSIPKGRKRDEAPDYLCVP